MRKTREVNSLGQNYSPLNFVSCTDGTVTFYCEHYDREPGERLCVTCARKISEAFYKLTR
jgi:hypothetical protein